MEISKIDSLLKENFVYEGFKDTPDITISIQRWLGENCDKVIMSEDYFNQKVLVKIIYEGKTYILDYDSY